MDFPHSVPNVALLDGRFTDGNPLVGIPASRDPAAWANAVTDEILNVIRAAELEPEEGRVDQLSEAVARIVANAATEATQEQAEAGEDGTRKMTPRRVFQALRSALANATETLHGTLRIGTQVEVTEGALDAVAVTPKTLRFGFAVSLTTNGYLIFPKWLLGIHLQWIRGTNAGDHSWPVEFPTACLSAICSDGNVANATVSVNSFSKTTVSIETTANSAFYCWAIGH